MVEFVSGNVFIRVMGEGKGLKPGEKVGGHLIGSTTQASFFAAIGMSRSGSLEARSRSTLSAKARSTS